MDPPEQPAPPSMQAHDDCMCVYVRSASGEYTAEEVAAVRAIEGMDETEVLDGWLVAHCARDAAALRAAAAAMAKLFPGRPVQWTSLGPM